MKTLLSRRIGIVVLSLGLAIALPAAGAADEVLDWNGVLQRAIAAGATPGPLQGRVAAIVHVSMFDALNGVERRFTPVHFDGEAPRGASVRAAVAQAAYTALTGLYPAQSFAADLEASLAGIGAEAASENSTSIALGRAFGEQVANAILAWRSTRQPGGAALPGQSRALESGGRRRGRGREVRSSPACRGRSRRWGATSPFVIPSGSSFRSPTGPPALHEPAVRRRRQRGEARRRGREHRAHASPDGHRALLGRQPSLSFFNQAAVTASADRHLTLSENARLFALLNVAMADAAISCWDSKY